MFKKKIGKREMIAHKSNNTIYCPYLQYFHSLQKIEMKQKRKPIESQFGW